MNDWLADELIQIIDIDLKSIRYINWQTEKNCESPTPVILNYRRKKYAKSDFVAPFDINAGYGKYFFYLAEKCADSGSFKLFSRRIRQNIVLSGNIETNTTLRIENSDFDSVLKVLLKQ
ncbi:type II secretory protein [Actinobacillus equuli]|nr:type II secretory protein [Actinobacillus equuli]